MLRSLPLATFLVLAASATAQANWLHRVGPAPSPRHGHGMAFDDARGVTVLFGGSFDSTSFADTWEWNGDTWTQRFPAVSPPPALMAKVQMVFDSARDVAVLVHPTGTWEWDGTNWAQRTTTPMNPYGIAFDPVRGRTVALMSMGGSMASQSSVMEWDGTTWATITSPTGPFHSIVGMAWHAGSQRVVAFTAFQGVSNPNAGARLWSWDGAVWTSSPQGVSTYVNGGVLVSYGSGIRAYGGLSNQMPLVGLYTPPATGLQTTSGNPNGRLGHAMAYDSLRNRIVLFGGVRYYTQLINFVRGDTWEYVESTLTAGSAPFGQGCGTPAPVLDAVPGSRPVLGATFVAEVANATAGATAMAWGYTGQGFQSFATMPIPLASWGMPGCWMHTGTISLLGCSTVGAATQFSLVVPNMPSLFGVQLDLQAFTFQAGANPLQIVGSNGLQVTVGNQ